MSQDNVTPEQHFKYLRDRWLLYFIETQDYLQVLDGDTSRAIGRIAYDLVEANDRGKELDWPSVAVAQFLKRDSMLWHELADSRKK